MLKLRRKKGDDIYIVIPGRELPIRITVERLIESPTYRTEVELGFDCESDIDVLRHELYEGAPVVLDDNRGNK